MYIIFFLESIVWYHIQRCAALLAATQINIKEKLELSQYKSELWCHAPMSVQVSPQSTCLDDKYSEYKVLPNEEIIDTSWEPDLCSEEKAKN